MVTVRCRRSNAVLTGARTIAAPLSECKRNNFDYRYVSFIQQKLVKTAVPVRPKCNQIIAMVRTP